MTRACSTAADVVGVGVAHGVPTDQWQCLGGSPWRREAFGAGSQGGGQRRRLGDDVAGRVLERASARSVVRVHVLGASGRHVFGASGAPFCRGSCPRRSVECGEASWQGGARWRWPESKWAW
jgi:hypothetical protein